MWHSRRARALRAMPTSNAAPPGSGVLVSIPSDAGPVPAIEYDGGSLPACGVVMCPGSSGGMGPGLSSVFRGLPIERRGSASAQGSLYARLSMELAGGVDINSWDPPVSHRKARMALDGTVGSAARASKTPRAQSRPFRVACLQMTWRQSANGVKWPGRKLRTVSALADAVDDVCACVRYLRGKYGEGFRVVVVGFSFGGAVAWAAARRLGAANVAGVVSIAGSMRGGRRFEDAALDTKGSIDALPGTPKLWVHGTADESVAPAVARHGFERASEPRCLVWVCGSGHGFDAARDAAYEPLKAFVAQTALSAYLVRIGGLAPFGKDPSDGARLTPVNCGTHILVAPAAGSRCVVAKRRRGRIGENKENRAGSSGETKNSAGFKNMVTAYDVELAAALATSRRAEAARAPRTFFREFSLGRKDPPGLGAGWVDVSRALGDGHAEAFSAMVELAPKLTIERLRSPSVKGYSE